MTLAGYEIRETIHQGVKSVVFRATRLADGRRVILKLPAGDRPDRRRIAELRHEHAIGTQLRAPGVSQVLSLLESDGQVALVLEDIDGISLRAYLDRSGKLAPERFVELVIKLCDALGDIHRQGVIHKDIKPQNVVVHPDTGTVKLIDFSIASTLSRETAAAASPRNLEGTLPYMAPEQTGRMNRGIDHRTDFYSLGVTCYELLSGRLPFAQRVPIELVHAHIALVPEPLHEVDPSVPRALSAIVARLLAKNAEDRYQSAQGCIADLEECLRQLRERGRIDDDFVPGRHDRTEIFQLPQKLYGRGGELARLSAAFERASTGGLQLLLVTGSAGAGKSVLVHELQKDITERRGFFISGKFDQLTRSVPYAPVAHAFRALVQQLLTEPPAVLAEWRDKLVAAVGAIGQVLVDLIAELGVILGPQPPVQVLGPTEAQNRFAIVFQSFIRVFATADHPLVIFLDDLQWVDAASLKLLQLLLTDAEGGHLLVIGAYRDNEVTAAHPLSLALEEVRKSGTQISEIQVGPLGLDDVAQLVADAFGCGRGRAESLGREVFDKTHGNPFFVNQFLRSLYSEGLLSFDRRAAAWVWDEKRISAAQVTDNVVDFMASKLRRLSAETQGVLKLAACIGHEFDLRTLSVIGEAGERETAAELWEALREGMVLPLHQEYRFVHAWKDSEGENDAPPFDISYRFLHDRVQQAAYSLIDEGQRQQVHLRIGRLMLARAGGDPQDDELFKITDHLNTGARGIADPAERMALARLNLAAGRKAKASTAHQAAAAYLRSGMELGGHAFWDVDYDLAFALHLDRAESEHLSGRFDEAEALFDVLLARARTRKERVEVQTLRVILAVTLVRLPAAIAAGAAGAAEFGIEIPDTDEARRAALGGVLGEVQALLAGRRAADLLDAPAVADPELRALMKLMFNLNTAAYFASPALFGLVAAQQVSLSLRHGHSDMSALGYCFYSMLLATALARYADAYEFGSLALALNEKYPNPELVAKVNVLFGAFVNHWRKPLRTGLIYHLRGYHAGLESGDFVYVSYSCDQTLFIKITSGEELGSVREEVEKFLELLQRMKSQNAIQIHTVMKQGIAALEGRTDGPFSLADETFEEHGFAEHLVQSGHRFPASWYYVVKHELAYLHGDARLALEMAIEAEKYVGSGGLYFTTDLVFFTCLTLVELALGAGEGERERYEAMIAERRKRLGTWTDECAVNFLHKARLVDAELARLAGDQAAALDAYEQAIELSRNNGFPHHEALANELCARFHLGRGRSNIARFHMLEALRGYERWGAVVKAKQLRKHYPQLLPASTLGGDDITTSRSITSSVTTFVTTEGTGALDLTSFMKASGAIAGEIVMERLLGRLIQIMVENAGAEHGSLLLFNGDALCVEAQLHPRTGLVQVGGSVPLSEAEHVCEAVVHYVWRTQEHLVLADAQSGGHFQKNGYIQAHDVRSVLCAPIKHHGKLTGILYLENNLVPDAFTQDRLRVLDLLSTQAAISIENARLYDTLDQRVKERTEELRRSNDDLSATLERLTITQRQLVMQEKLASLGALTSGIAHEIQNPLNFVNNFAESSVELSTELVSVLDRQDVQPDREFMETIGDLAADLKENAARIHEHGRRADRIVKAMLEHSRGSSGERCEVDLNALVAQYLNLAVGGILSSNQSQKVHVETDYDPSLSPILNRPQDLGRVILNLVNNACYAVRTKQQRAGGGYRPTLKVSTKNLGEAVELRVRDNGIGIPEAERDKIFLPFYTTKPTGEGTGLGLSISYDIIVNGNGGELRCESQEGQFTEFIVKLKSRGGAQEAPADAARQQQQEEEDEEETTDGIVAAPPLSRNPSG